MARKDRDEPSTEELRTAAAGRESDERNLLDESVTKDEAHQHERRADKQAYLKRKLEERQESERSAEGDE